MFVSRKIALILFSILPVLACSQIMDDNVVYNDPTIISTHLIIGESNELVIGHTKHTTKESSQYVVLGGEINGEYFKGSTLSKDMTVWFTHEERVKLTLFYKEYSSLKIQIISSPYVTCIMPANYINEVEKGYLVIRNRGNSKVFFDELRTESFINQYKNNTLNSKLLYPETKTDVLKQIRLENAYPISYDIWPDVNGESDFSTKFLTCSDNQTFEDWFDSINVVGFFSNTADEVFYSREKLHEYWTTALRTKEKILKRETDLEQMYIEYHNINTYPLITGYEYKIAPWLDTIMTVEESMITGPRQYTFTSLKEIDVIIMTYRKLGNEIRYNEVYFARKTNLHRKPIITASFPYIESFEPNLNNNSSSHWYALLSKKKVGKFIKDNMKGRRRLSNAIVTPKRFEEYPTDVDIDCFNCIDFLNFDIEFLLNYE